MTEKKEILEELQELNSNVRVAVEYLEGIEKALYELFDNSEQVTAAETPVATASAVDEDIKPAEVTPKAKRRNLK
jgi:regulator of replication initiation timing